MHRALKKIIDLRSDTVTRMSQSMIEALKHADVGDDVYDDDPTLKKLEATVAKMLGKERGIFTIGGTMSNLIAIMAHCSRGETALIGQGSHIQVYEQGGIASIANVFPNPVPELPDGSFDLSVLQSKILPPNPHFSVTTLVALENTYNYLGGVVLSLDYPSQIAKFCKENNLKLHLDGSRLLNAYYHHKKKNPQLKVSDLTEQFDSSCMCLTKVLRCPLGSILVGSDEFISKALRIRKILGGGIRQIGYIAAAALQSLEESKELIPIIHKNTKTFASELKKLGIVCNDPQSNIVIFWPQSKLTGNDFSMKLKENGVLANSRLDGSIRIIFHPDVDEQDLYSTIEIIKNIR